MYDLNSLLNEYYNSELRLKEAERNKLREYKKLNFDRVCNGIDAINEEENKSYPYPELLEQGSIPMHTANNHPDNDYDIDVALIFPSDSISSSPLEARKLVEKALKKKAGNFSRDPEARTNAVTVWYSEGYHVDFAIHRKRENFWGTEVIEHAGSEWTERDPRAITNWFNEKVQSKSPSQALGATVETGQLRKIVRFVKQFSKSRSSWSLPGGIIITSLVEECYSSDYNRDDIALYKTIVNINNRLKYNKTVLNPVDSSSELTYKSQFQNQVKRLAEKLELAVQKLAVLQKNDCTEEEARKACKWFFNSSFWAPADTTESVVEQQTSLSPQLSLTVSLHKSKEGFRLHSNVPNGGMNIPKKMWLKFVATTSVQPPFKVKWLVENEGDEAEENKDLSHESHENFFSNGSISHWERTMYKGAHKMICIIVKNEVEIAKSIFIVKVKR